LGVQHRGEVGGGSSDCAGGGRAWKHVCKQDQSGHPVCQLVRERITDHTHWIGSHTAGDPSMRSLQLPPRSRPRPPPSHPRSGPRRPSRRCPPRPPPPPPSSSPSAPPTPRPPPRPSSVSASPSTGCVPTPPLPDTHRFPNRPPPPSVARRSVGREDHEPMRVRRIPAPASLDTGSRGFSTMDGRSRTVSFLPPPIGPNRVRVRVRVRRRTGRSSAVQCEAETGAGIEKKPLNFPRGRSFPFVRRSLVAYKSGLLRAGGGVYTPHSHGSHGGATVGPHSECVTVIKNCP